MKIPIDNIKIISFFLYIIFVLLPIKRQTYQAIMYRIFLLFLFITIISNSFAQESTGLIPIQKFNSDKLGAQPHCFAFAQDSRGAIYVGNKVGLLVYTGKWSKFLTNNASEIRGMKIVNDGKIYIGNENGFGYFTPNSSGKFEYTPIDTLLSKDQRSKLNKTQIVFEKDSAIYFASGNFIYKYYNKTIKIIAIDNEVSGNIKINNRILIIIKSKGLFELINDKLVLINNNEKFFIEKNSQRVVNIASMQKISNNEILYLTKHEVNNELRILNIKTGESKKFNTQLDSLFNKLKPDGIQIINNTLIAIKIKNKGIFIINKQGHFIRKVDKSSGLLSDVIETMFVDNSNILWVAHRTGISRVDLLSNYEYIPLDKLGIKDAIEDIKSFNDTLFIAVQNQLSYYDFLSFDNNRMLTLDDINKLSNPKCLPINQSLSKNKGCYGLLNFEVENYKSLLVITTNNILEKKVNGSIDTAYNKSGYKLFQDKKDPNRIWISLYPKGLASIYFEDGKWIDEGVVENTSYELYDINADKDNNIWFGTYGLLKLTNPTFIDHKISNPKVIVYDTTDGLSANDTYIIHRYGEEILFASNDGLYQYNEKNNYFNKSDFFGEWIKNHFTFRMYSNKKGETWTISYPKDESNIYIKSLTANSEGSFFMNTVFAKQIKSQRFLSLYPFNGDMIAGGDFSLVKFKSSSETDSLKKISIFINNIETTNKRSLFGGTFTNSKGKFSDIQNPKSVLKLDYKDNNFDFKFTSFSDNVDSEIEYRWWLEGNDDNWEEWVNKSEVRFTNLHEGDYTFWVQAKDIYGITSQKLAFKFTVNPPWHRTLLAFIIYIILFGGFVWGAIQFSTRRLKIIINEATAEIQEQKNDIEHKNEEIVSSIRYAQRIQEAVIPNNKQMKKEFPEHFVLWKPRDIVSGDYYWMMKKHGKTILAAADCTGHGVPGAFMSIMGISFLNQIANNPMVQTAASALDMLRQSVVTSLNQEGSETNTKDGMDMSICVYDFENMTMEFAGAYNPMYMIRDGKLSTFKADRMPIGIHERDKNPFTNTLINMHKDDKYYILSDGYIDQFGGPKGKKFMTKRFKNLILEIHEKPMTEQKEILWNTLLDWRGDIEQLDDIIVIGVRV